MAKGGAPLERKFQKDLKKELIERYPGCMVTKQDAQQIQGIPDLLILYGATWATLENKRADDASHRPNQDYYVDKMNSMSFSRFISPENKESVLDELDLYFKKNSKKRK